jgi:hypothetical protein
MGTRLAEVAQTTQVIQTWDPAQTNAAYGEVFGGPVDDLTLQDWIIAQRGDWRQQGWLGTAISNIVVITSAGAGSLVQQMNTLVHELLHVVVGETAGHVGVAQALGIYRDFSQLGGRVNDAIAGADVASWLERCIGDAR